MNLRTCGLFLLALALVAVLALAVWPLLETPPAARTITNEAFKKIQEEVRLSNAKLELKQQISYATSFIEGTPISTPFKNEINDAIKLLREAISTSSDENAVRAKSAQFEDRYRPLQWATYCIAQAEKFLTDFGQELSTSLNSQVEEKITAVRQAMMGDDWEQLRASTHTLEALYATGPSRIVSLNSTTEFVRRPGINISRELREKIEIAVTPLRRSLKGTSWDLVRDEYSKLPDLYQDPNKIFSAIDNAKRIADSLSPSEEQKLLSALDDVNAALRGTSWERVEDQAEKLGQVQRRIATESDHNGSVASSCVRVLSIDGGGIRGIIPAMFLAELERRTNQPIAKLFDYIVGTSTGGIIALGLAAPDAKHPDQPLHKADELIALYSKEGSRIFPRRPLQGLLGLLWPKYRADDIEKILKDYFGDLLLGDALTKVVIPTYLLEGKGVKSHFFLDSYSDSAVFIYMREAARATSAAPTYFPPYQIPWLTGPVALIDGGVFANNPAPYALSIVKRNERRDFLERYPLLMVSLGTGKLPHTNQFKQAWRWGDIGWIKPILDITLSDPGVEDEAHDLMNFSDLYFRFQPTLDDLTAELDNATDANIAALTKIAETSIQENKTGLDRLVTQLKRGRPRGCQRTGL